MNSVKLSLSGEPMDEHVNDFPTIKARLDHIDEELRRTRVDLRTLLDAEAERRGRESVLAENFANTHDDRWQVWVRSLFPVTVLTGIATYLWNLMMHSGGGN